MGIFDSIREAFGGRTNRGAMPSDVDLAHEKSGPSEFPDPAQETAMIEAVAQLYNRDNGGATPDKAVEKARTYVSGFKDDSQNLRSDYLKSAAEAGFSMKEANQFLKAGRYNDFGFRSEGERQQLMNALVKEGARPLENTHKNAKPDAGQKGPWLTPAQQIETLQRLQVANKDATSLKASVSFKDTFEFLRAARNAGLNGDQVVQFAANIQKAGISPKNAAIELRKAASLGEKPAKIVSDMGGRESRRSLAQMAGDTFKHIQDGTMGPGQSPVSWLIGSALMTGAAAGFGAAFVAKTAGGLAKEAVGLGWDALGRLNERIAPKDAVDAKELKAIVKGEEQKPVVPKPDATPVIMPSEPALAQVPDTPAVTPNPSETMKVGPEAAAQPVSYEPDVDGPLSPDEFNALHGILPNNRNSEWGGVLDSVNDRIVRNVQEAEGARVSDAAVEAAARAPTANEAADFAARMADFFKDDLEGLNKSLNDADAKISKAESALLDAKMNNDPRAAALESEYQSLRERHDAVRDALASNHPQLMDRLAEHNASKNFGNFPDLNLDAVFGYQQEPFEMREPELPSSAIPMADDKDMMGDDFWKFQETPQAAVAYEPVAQPEPATPDVATTTEIPTADSETVTADQQDLEQEVQQDVQQEVDAQAVEAAQEADAAQEAVEAEVVEQTEVVEQAEEARQAEDVEQTPDVPEASEIEPEQPEVNAPEAPEADAVNPEADAPEADPAQENEAAEEVAEPENVAPEDVTTEDVTTETEPAPEAEVEQPQEAEVNAVAQDAVEPDQAQEAQEVEPSAEVDAPDQDAVQPDPVTPEQTPDQAAAEPAQEPEATEPDVAEQEPVAADPEATAVDQDVEQPTPEVADVQPEQAPVQETPDLTPEVQTPDAQEPEVQPEIQNQDVAAEEAVPAQEAGAEVSSQEAADPSVENSAPEADVNAPEAHAADPAEEPSQEAAVQGAEQDVQPEAQQPAAAEQADPAAAEPAEQTPEVAAETAEPTLADNAAPEAAAEPAEMEPAEAAPGEPTPAAEPAQVDVPAASEPAAPDAAEPAASTPEAAAPAEAPSEAPSDEVKSDAQQVEPEPAAEAGPDATVQNTDAPNADAVSAGEQEVDGPQAGPDTDVAVAAMPSAEGAAALEADQPTAEAVETPDAAPVQEADAPSAGAAEPAVSDPSLSDPSAAASTESTAEPAAAPDAAGDDDLSPVPGMDAQGASAQESVEGDDLTMPPGDLSESQGLDDDDDLAPPPTEESVKNAPVEPPPAVSVGASSVS